MSQKTKGPTALVASFADDLRCATRGCSGGLQTTPDGSLACEICAKPYPLLHQCVPIVVEDPFVVIARELTILQGGIQSYRSERERRMREAMHQPERGDFHREAVRALEINIDYLVAIRDAQTPLLSPTDVLENLESPKNDYASYNVVRHPIFSLLRRDWGGACETEKEISATLKAVDEQLGDIADSAKVLVVGAGTGRLPFELSKRFANLIAIDISPIMATAFALFKRSMALHVCELESKNLKAVADQVREVCTDAPEQMATTSLRYVLGDARNMPIRDSTMDAVVSVFATDTVPLRQLLPEVHRILKPNGSFVHVGPLGYHFDEASAHYAAQEIPGVFQESGFSIGPMSWFKGFHCANDSSMYNYMVEQLCFRATKDRGIQGRKVNADAVLALHDSLELNLRSRVTHEDELATAQVRLRSGEYLTISISTYSILRLLDGKSPLSELARAVDGTRIALAEIQSLVAQGLVRIVGEGPSI